MRLWDEAWWVRDERSEDEEATVQAEQRGSGPRPLASRANGPDCETRRKWGDARRRDGWRLRTRNNYRLAFCTVWLAFPSATFVHRGTCPAPGFGRATPELYASSDQFLHCGPAMRLREYIRSRLGKAPPAYHTPRTRL